MSKNNECFMCSNRFCLTGIVSLKSNKPFNEVACLKHEDSLKEHADRVIGKSDVIDRLSVTANEPISRTIMKKYLKEYPVEVDK